MDRYIAAIDRWFGARVPFALIEDRIHAFIGLPEEQIDWLWLYAWSKREHYERMADLGTYRQSV
jgi:hypothetical protein